MKNKETQVYDDTRLVQVQRERLERNRQEKILVEEGLTFAFQVRLLLDVPQEQRAESIVKAGERYLERVEEVLFGKQEQRDLFDK